MKTLYIDCSMGAAGDMIMSALVELTGNSEEFVNEINNINIPGVNVSVKKAVKCGITGTHTDVYVNGEEESEDMHHHHHHHSHNTMEKIEGIIRSLNVNENVIKNAIEVYRIIAEAESRAHNKKIEDIHFHEVGTMDAVADIVGVCMLIDEIAPDKIIASPVNTGSGQVKCAHGILPVPAPATAHILRGVPVYSDGTMSELCTPTGAALLKHFVSEFSPMPVMVTESIGYGMGTKDFEKANCLRIFMGEISDGGDEITELNCNVDDMTGEEIGFACEKMREEGALEVFTTAVFMKKNRPGTLITCLCRNSDSEKLAGIIFRYTSTIGMRKTVHKRYVLERREEIVNTSLGCVRIKYSKGYGVNKVKAEYNDIADIAARNNMSVDEVRSEVYRNIK